MPAWSVLKLDQLELRFRLIHLLNMGVESQSCQGSDAPQSYQRQRVIGNGLQFAEAYQYAARTGVGVDLPPTKASAKGGRDAKPPKAHPGHYQPRREDDRFERCALDRGRKASLFWLVIGV